jgi:two-component system sensor histidine kinase TctE
VLARIIDELLGNALNYAKTRVHVALSKTQREATLSVSDDGPGVPRAEREAVFDRFTRGSTSVPGGSGLGLALVRESIAGLGGSARAGESRWGGLDVTVRMPASDPSARRSQSAKSPTPVKVADGEPTSSEPSVRQR